MKELIKSIRWILFVSRRFSSADRSGRSAATSLLSVLGIAFGVMTLITVISVMNGFQMGYIESIMEISSYHVRAGSVKDEKTFTHRVSSQNGVLSITPFYEAQALVSGKNNRYQGVLLRALPPDVLESDRGFASQLKIVSGSFNLESGESIVLGSTLSRQLGVSVGDKVNLLAVSGGADTDLLSSDRFYTVSGIFYSGYAEINSTFAFVSGEDAQKLFGSGVNPVYGIKIKNSKADARLIAAMQEEFPEVEFESWRSYNRAFFGALQIEKNILMMLVFIIFVVVGVNIYNGMRRSVYERREEISILSALGGKSDSVRAIFVMQGLLTGCTGAFAGLLLGLLISVRIDVVFGLFADLTYTAQYLFYQLFLPKTAELLQRNSIYRYYARIPARILFGEVVWITLFGVVSSLAAAWAASGRVLKMSVAEVLRDE